MKNFIYIKKTIEYIKRINSTQPLKSCSKEIGKTGNLKIFEFNFGKKWLE